MGTRQHTTFRSHANIGQAFVVLTHAVTANAVKITMVRLYHRDQEMQIADTLSRAYTPLPPQHTGAKEFEYINMMNFISIIEEKYAEVQRRTAKEMNPLHRTILTGWLDHRSEVPLSARPYWDSRDQLSVSDGVIYNSMRIVIPPNLQTYMLKLIHGSHLGMVKCKQRAREVMYWK